MLVTSILYLMFVTCPMLVTSEESKLGVTLYLRHFTLTSHHSGNVDMCNFTEGGKQYTARLQDGRSLTTVASGDHRDKRQVTNKNMQGFTEKQKLSILQKHNDLRALAGASNMLKMTWDPKLATLAQNYADQCKFEHSSNRYNVAGFAVVGENLYAGTGDFEPATVVQAWFDEVKDYNYATNACKRGAMCGHYTQVVWAESGAVGCGAKYCRQFHQAQSIGFNSGYLVVCNYGPAGNYVGEKPFLQGKPCSQCPNDKPFCDHGLCSTSRRK